MSDVGGRRAVPVPPAARHLVPLAEVPEHDDVAGERAQVGIGERGRGGRVQQARGEVVAGHRQHEVQVVLGLAGAVDVDLPEAGQRGGQRDEPLEGVVHAGSV